MSIHLQARGRLVAAICFAVVTLAACSGSSATAPAGAGAGQPAAGASSAPGGSVPIAGAGGTDARYCAAMKVADAQALIKPTIAAAQTGGPLSCAFVLPGEGINGDNLTVNVFPDDADKQFYNEAATTNAIGTPNPLPGVGDIAEWDQPVAGATAPEVNAHQGSITCEVQPPADTSQLTIEQTGNGPIYQISEAAAAAFAAKEAVLCTDMFSVGS
jgi:hypothetical protein